MSKITPNQIFLAGFVFGIIIFVLLNIFFPAARNCGFSTLCDFQGFPFSFYRAGYEERDGGNYVSEIIWFGLLADILLTILFSFIFGLIFRFIWIDMSTQSDLDLE